MRQRKKIPVFLFQYFSFPLTWLDDRYIFSLVIDVFQHDENSSTILDEISCRESAPALPPKTYPMNKKRHSIHDIPHSAPPLPPRSPLSPRSSFFFNGMSVIIFFVCNWLQPLWSQILPLTGTCILFYFYDMHRTGKWTTRLRSKRKFSAHLWGVLDRHQILVFGGWRPGWRRLCLF